MDNHTDTDPLACPRPLPWEGVMTTRMMPTLGPVAREAARDALRTEAAATHSRYPQYDGYFSTWRLFVVTERTTYKSGTVFEPGRIVLADPEVRLAPGVPATRSAYDVDTTHVCAVPHERIWEIS